MLLTFRTVPSVVRPKLLLAGVELQTLAQIYNLLLGSSPAVTRVVLAELLGGLLTEELGLGLGMPVQTEVVLGVETDAGVFCKR